MLNFYVFTHTPCIFGNDYKPNQLNPVIKYPSFPFSGIWASCNAACTYNIFCFFGLTLICNRNPSTHHTTSHLSSSLCRIHTHIFMIYNSVELTFDDLYHTHRNIGIKVTKIGRWRKQTHRVQRPWPFPRNPREQAGAHFLMRMPYMIHRRLMTLPPSIVEILFLLVRICLHACFHEDTQSVCVTQNVLPHVRIAGCQRARSICEMLRLFLLKRGLIFEWACES